MFISNNCTSFHLWRKENLVKHQKISKCYENDCSLVTSGGLPLRPFLFVNYNRKVNMLIKKVSNSLRGQIVFEIMESVILMNN